MSALENVLYRLQTIKNPTVGNDIISTGLQSVDVIMNGGFRKGSFYLIGASEDVGKTALLVTFSSLISSTESNKVGIITLDLTPERMLERVLSYKTGIWLEKISRGLMDDFELEQILQTEIINTTERILINESCWMTIDDIELMIINWKAKGANIFFIDSLLHIETSETQLFIITQKLQELSRRLNICIVTTVRLVKSQYGQLLTLKDLRNVGAIEKLLDVVLFLYRPEYYDTTIKGTPQQLRGETHLKLEKNNFGILNSVRLKANLHIQRFIEHEFKK